MSHCCSLVLLCPVVWEHSTQDLSILTASANSEAQGAGTSLMQWSDFLQVHSQKWEAGPHGSSVFNFWRIQKHYTLLARIENATAAMRRGVRVSCYVCFFFVSGFWCFFFFLFFSYYFKGFINDFSKFVFMFLLFLIFFYAKCSTLNFCSWIDLIVFIYLDYFISPGPRTVF